MSNFKRQLIKYKERIKRSRPVLSIGAFDGCHVGHRKIFDQVDHVITFSPIPKRYFNPREQVLNTDDEKRWLYPDFFFLTFDHELSRLTPEEFIHPIVEILTPDKIIVGWDFHFGHRMSGDHRLLEKMGKKIGFDVKVLPPIRASHHIIKSTTIRRLIRKGLVNRASMLLGYNYFYMSKVIRGKGVGKDLGFPTINLDLVSEKLLPHTGVYSGYTYINNQSYTTAISIVRKQEHVDIEGHLIGVSNVDLYGEQVRLEFVERIRDQQHFTRHEELSKQIHRDIAMIQDKLESRSLKADKI